MAEFTCATHGGRSVEGVCGECGEPLCQECVDKVRDPLFDHYETEGPRRLILILFLVIGLPLLLNTFLLDALIQIRKDLIPQTIVIFNPGILHSSVIFGIALVPTLYYRTSSQYSGTVFVHRQATERILCAECANNRSQRVLYYGIVGAAVLFVSLGVYLILQSFGAGRVDLTSLRVSAIGGGIYVLRDELVYRLKVQFG
ncbi:MAG: hypothetical protein ACI91T_002498 [Natronomonas sp.]|jgi:hypothetical protein